MPRGFLGQWRAFQQAQRAALAESNRVTLPDDPPPAEPEPTLFPETLGPVLGAPANPPPAAASGSGNGSGRFGEVGRPLNRHSPFFIGFVGALGALLAIGLWQTAGRLAATVTILLVAIFLTLALNPIVEFLTRRGVRRGLAVTIVFGGLLLVLAIVGMIVIPPVVAQSTELVQRTPALVQDLLNSEWVQRLDREHHDVIATAQAEINKRLTDQGLWQGVLGGILGVGQLVLSSVFQTLTVLVLSLYFLASFPTIKHAAFAMVPASRRARVTSLSEEIMRRTGSYALGQLAIASFNALMSWFVLSLLGIPYAAVLAVAVGFLGLVPMVGATLGAAVAVSVAFFTSPGKALILVIYYVVYQQIENYLIAPRVMQRTVSVPGAVTIVAALTGGTVMGLLGALLAIPVAAGLLLLYEEVLLPRQDQH